MAQLYKSEVYLFIYFIPKGTDQSSPLGFTGDIKYLEKFLKKAAWQNRAKNISRCKIEQITAKAV